MPKAEWHSTTKLFALTFFVLQSRQSVRSTRSLTADLLFHRFLKAFAHE